MGKVGGAVAACLVAVVAILISAQPPWARLARDDAWARSDIVLAAAATVIALPLLVYAGFKARWYWRGGAAAQVAKPIRRRPFSAADRRAGVLRADWRAANPTVYTLPEYLGSLAVPDDATAERVVLALAGLVGGASGRGNLWALAAVLSLCPERFRRADVVARLKGVPAVAAQAVQLGMPSALVLAAAAEVRRVRLANADAGAADAGAADAGKDQASAMARFSAGEEPGVAPSLADLIPNPFVVDRDVPRLLAALRRAPGGADAYSAAEPAPARPEPACPAALPGLCAASCLPASTTGEQAALNRLWAILLNRLAANANARAAEGDEAGRSPPFAVRLAGDAAPATSVELLLRQLLSREGNRARVVAGVVTQLTSFGVRLCVRQGAKYFPIALFYSERTGVIAGDGATDLERCTQHTGVQLRVRGGAPATSFDLQFYQGLEGFTGWHPEGGYDEPWATPEMSTWHTTWEGETAADAAAMASALAVAANHVADRWPTGGYGVLGVCSDSAAAVEAGMAILQNGKLRISDLRENVTTVYGLRGHGPARVALASECSRQIAKVKRGSRDHARFAALRLAVLSLPGDIVVLPGEQRSAARRLRATIGPKWREDGSPFLLHKRTLAAVKKVI